MKIVGIIAVVIVILFVIGSWIARSENHIFPSRNITDNLQTNLIKPTPHPLSIEGMTKRSYDGGRIVIEKKVRETNSFTSEVVSYTSDGLKLHALLNTPKADKPTAGWPVVIVNHGHIPPKQYSTENSYINTSAYYANAGFLVLKPDYRGHDKSQGSADGLINRIEYAIDVLNLMASINTLKDADVNRIYMYGHSMGGDVTLRILEVNNQVKAASLWAPAVTTFPESLYYFRRKNTTGEAELLQAQSEFAELTENNIADDFSPFAHVDQIKIPLLLHHGTNDESVPYQWGVDLDKQLRASNKDVTFYSYQNDNHDIVRNWGTALSRDVVFFKTKP